ncbi:GNAT family N-acetyltransferase [Oleidesulfovibrio sp.]|uniref:GNAT family N-acetyltransferase n=1 Tax=Oleidesulfovibrio sp. TaxID=2909707 RepID=UPI003A8A77D8
MHRTAPHSTTTLQDVTFRRKVLPSDAATVRAIVKATGFFTTEEADVAEELVTEHLQHGAASGYLFVFAQMETTVTGYACYGPTPATEGTYDLYWIAVNPHCQHIGLGAALLNEVTGDVRAAGGRLLFAETSGTPDYTPTRRFYERTGFTAEAVLKDFYRKNDDKVIFRLEVV